VLEAVTFCSHGAENATESGIAMPEAGGLDGAFDIDSVTIFGADIYCEISYPLLCLLRPHIAQTTGFKISSSS
jgi:hypothetical protein